MLVDGRNVVLKERREELRRTSIATRICVGLPSNSFALQKGSRGSCRSKLAESQLPFYLFSCDAAASAFFPSLHSFSTFATINCIFCARIRTASYSRAGQHLTVDTIRQTANMGEAVVGLIGMGDMGKMYARRLSEAGWRYAFAPNTTLLV